MTDPAMSGALIHAVTFAAAAGALIPAHYVGDMWVQTDWQAAHKGDRGWLGRLACLAHVATYTLTAAIMAGGMLLATGLPVSPWRFLAGLAVSAATHYIADRRTPLRWLAEHTPGKAGFIDYGTPRPGRDDNPSLGTGAHALDQAWHLFWTFVAALII